MRLYGEETENKAQAGSREKALTWRTGHRESAFAAEQAALEGCQIRYGNPCILIAANSIIASIPADGSWIGRSMSRVNYEGQFDALQLPVMRPETRSRKDVIEYLSTSGPKAAAIHPWGRIFTSFGSLRITLRLYKVAMLSADDAGTSLSRFVFSSILVAVTAYWIWFLFSHAGQIFRH